MYKRVVLVLCCWLAAGCCALSAAVSPEETQKQNDFKKAYAAADKNDRKNALQLLNGLTDPSTLALLTSACNNDSDKDVRLEAFRVLSLVPARDTSVAQALVGIFQRIGDFDQKLEYATHLTNSKFKAAATAAVADWGSRLRYPDLIKPPAPPKNPPKSNAANKNQPPDPNVRINKEREQFTRAFGIFNTLTQANLAGPDKDSPAAIRKWWDANSAKVTAADNDVLAKCKAEDQAKQAAQPDQK
ncbi:MAG: hypothetical protein NTW87_09175 [Planctomycetota bacterium]|nr:hypothetical protein [Planctomycetota bacterium]